MSPNLWTLIPLDKNYAEFWQSHVSWDDEIVKELLTYTNNITTINTYYSTVEMTFGVSSRLYLPLIGAKVLVEQLQRQITFSGNSASSSLHLMKMRINFLAVHLRKARETHSLDAKWVKKRTSWKRPRSTKRDLSIATVGLSLRRDPGF